MLAYKDFWLRIERRDDGFWVTSRSPAGGESSAPFKLPPDWENYHLSTLLGGMRGGATGDERRDIVFKGEAPKPENVGSELFRALFNGPIRDAFNRNWGSGKEGGVRIRIQTDLNDPQLAKLASLPWELLYNEGTRTALGRSKLTPIVRYLDVPLSYEAYPFDGTLRVLIVLANPEGTHPLDLAKEKDSIEQTWAKLDGVEVTIIEHATQQAMFDKLDTGTYHVLHYMGHGGFDAESGGGVLFLEDEEGAEAPLSGKMLGETLYEMPSMRLVFLNACDTGKTSHEDALDPFSGVASALVMAGVPAVVAMQVPVSDRAALEFADKFYDQLVHGEPVDAAVAVGRRAIHRANPASLEWATPVLFMRAPDGRLFAAPEPKPPGLPGEWKRFAIPTGFAALVLVVLCVWWIGTNLFARDSDNPPDPLVPPVADTLESGSEIITDKYDDIINAKYSNIQLLYEIPYTREEIRIYGSDGTSESSAGCGADVSDEKPYVIASLDTSIVSSLEFRVEAETAETWLRVDFPRSDNSNDRDTECDDVGETSVVLDNPKAGKYYIWMGMTERGRAIATFCILGSISESTENSCDPAHGEEEPSGPGSNGPSAANSGED